jgi:tRNA A37 threonylcarbamoyladenosine biosynthesis protein TsaE
MHLRNQPLYHETLIYSTYFAPRGRQRLYMLGSELSQRYLYPSDLLIGVLGSEGSGKSTLIQGLFPGLHLTNDDDGINMKQSPIYDFSEDNFFSGHTFHLDVRYELAFKQRYEIAEAINSVVSHGRRAVVEHFDLIYESLGYNAQVIFGIGEEVIVARPTLFGPHPGAIKKVVDKTIKYRLMAHTAEDITSYILEEDYKYKRPVLHSDIKHGFIISFKEKPEIDIEELEEKVLTIIEANLTVAASGEDTITFGDMKYFCTGVRTHVKSTSEIQNFHLHKEFKYNPITDEYYLMGMVGKKEIAGFEDITDLLE